ncbi:MAG: PBP1A family penicillin-binding protein [Gammaproteobacteria bacterium]|nr:PBP1A family penicillin-binding protein [Gammaproteobacteria bacterium]
MDLSKLMGTIAWLRTSRHGKSRGLLVTTAWISGVVVCAFVVNLAALFLYLDPQLPEAEAYRHYRYETPLRILTRDGKLIAEFGERRLIPIALRDAPDLYLQGVIATEDKRFYTHSGIDWISLANDMVELVFEPEVVRGASTITMQLPRNVADLSRDKTVIRKVKEMLLALKIERELTKDEILELYINVVPFGKRAYGVKAASYTYYNKPPNELTLPQLAMLAGVPKRPEAGNPINGPEWALDRRNLVLRRMRDAGVITLDEYEEAVVTPITAKVYTRQLDLHAPYPAEIARKELLNLYGDDIYTGFSIYTSIDFEQQAAAQQAIRNELEAYDRTYGYRGPEGRMDVTMPVESILEELGTYSAIYDFEPAVVLSLETRSAKVLRANGNEETIPWQGISWAKRALDDAYVGAAPSEASDVLSVGDVVRTRMEEGEWVLGQIPAVSGALVAVDPKTGGVSALVGGYSFEVNQYNHATQARRQPGSSFKPFVYSAALHHGVTPATVFLDAPLVFEDPSMEGSYRPKNDGGTYRGPTRLREALMKSINLVSIRVLTSVGGNKVIDYLPRFGFDTTQMPSNTQVAIGGGSLAYSPLEMASAYSVFANGGYKIQPHLIEKVIGRDGSATYEPKYPLVCNECEEAAGLQASVDDGLDGTDFNESPQLLAPRVIDARNAFLMNSMLRDVVRRGTGSKALELQRDDLAGKTGTTDEALDTWFNGFHPELVATVWVGFPQQQSLGRFEYGSTRPLSIWMKFMERALLDVPDRPLRQPNGIVRVRIDPETGQLASHAQSDAIFEYFRDENSPAGLAEGRRGVDSDVVSPENIF